ncbi:hypothetical protein G4B88_016568 [Cannabis sativa]|uniref:DNA topoisomerase (ATP-hydrolyzing) n=1 Tax=Cannabis sativa TaxID=3483 RepID=A0A7J6H9I5_CANSA|nr:hypothetical protein G4B88_016568 [Cannabis sativa]
MEGKYRRRRSSQPKPEPGDSVKNNIKGNSSSALSIEFQSPLISFIQFIPFDQFVSVYVLFFLSSPEFTRAIVEDLCKGRSPVISIDRFSSYCTNSDSICCCSSDFPNGREILTFKRENQVHRIDVLLRVLLIVQKLLQENKHGSKRDIYYMHPAVFSDQSVVDRAINDICVLMQCSRHNLNVVSVGNGFVMGWLRFSESEKIFDCINRPSTAHPIPVHVEEVKDVVSVAKYILVVEKESVFQRLANDQFCNKNRCIVITGRGYPDIPTRRFLRLLIDTLHLPAYCLVDCDPYGFDILCTYRFGSMVRHLDTELSTFHACLCIIVSFLIQSKLTLLLFKQMAYDSKNLRVPEIKWIGVFPSDFDKYCIPNQCFLPLTLEDKRKTESMLLRCYLQREVPQWRGELEVMLQRGVKFEIEALSVCALSFLSDEYLPSKIQGGLYI